MTSQYVSVYNDYCNYNLNETKFNSTLMHSELKISLFFVFFKTLTLNHSQTPS